MTKVIDSRAGEENFNKDKMNILKRKLFWQDEDVNINERNIKYQRFFNDVCPSKILIFE